MFKKCFKCNIKYPLFFYPVNNRKYQLKTAKGRGLVCKSCLFKEVIRNGSYVQFINNEPVVIKVNKTIKNAFKRVFNL